MKYRPLGRTGLTVSALSLGTASLGIDYGIQAPGEFGRPDEDEAMRVVERALDRGITLIDTAPAYGEAERIVGRAIGRDPRVIVATKISPGSPPYVASGPSAGSAPSRATSTGGFSRAVVDSIESSLRALDRDVIDILQIHNATREMIDDVHLMRALVDAKKRGLVRFLGATVYDDAAGLAVIETGEYDTLQMALSVLDQRKLRAVMPAADAAGIGVIARSAFLKGALTKKAEHLPGTLAPLRDAAARARDALADGSWDELAQAAIRFCLSAPHVSTVLAGARRLDELDAALDAEAAGPLDAGTMSVARKLAIRDDALLDPSRWPPLGL